MSFGGMIPARPAIQEELDNIRRSLDRAQIYFEDKHDSPALDYVEHIRNQVAFLRGLLNL